MIRLVQRKLIIPRGDTGSFSIPVLPNTNSGDIAVFSILNPLKHERLFDKEIKEFDNSLQIRFTHEETVNLPAGQYNWDIKLYRNPVIENNILISGEEIDSYYAAFSLPICEIRETGDNYIVSPDAPNSYLRPDQIEIITGAITALNAAVEKTEQNVEHYPKIIDEQWYTWDAESGGYVATGVSANGNTGNGIESAVLNNDYTLTLNFTDGTSYTTTSIRGTTGNGIEDIVLNNDYTLTIIYSDGNSYTTPSIRGPIGPTPQFSIGTVQEGAAAAATITGTAENPVLNLTLSNANVPTRVSQLENDSGYLNTETDPTVPAWAKAANKPTYTAAEVGATTEQEVNEMIADAIGDIHSFEFIVVNELPIENIKTNVIYLVPKSAAEKDIYDEYLYIGNNWEKIGNTQASLSDYALKSELPTKVSDLTDDSGHYTKPANGIPASDLADGVIPTVPVQDIQINGASVIQNGIANIPIAGMKLGAVRVAATSGIDINSALGILSLSQTTDAMIKAGTSIYAISPKTQHAATFYGLAKAAGDTTQAASDNAVGTYTDEAKAAIRSMLGTISDQAGTGLTINNGTLAVNFSSASTIKEGTATNKVVYLGRQHISTFYGLAKAAGDTTQSLSDNAVGSYTDEAKAAIQNMLSVPSSTDFNTLVSTLGTKYEDLIFPLSTPTYCVHDNELYLLRAPITSQKEWDSNDWIKTNVGNTLKNLTEQTTNTETSINQILNQLAPFEYNPPTSTRNYNVNDLFTYDGKLYQATAQINIGDTITPNTNCKTTKVSKSFVRDVQIDNTTVLNNGVANIPLSDYVTKVSLDNAGINNKTYTTKLGGVFSVTTAAATGYTNPYARATATGRLDKTKYHRITVNGTEYVLRTRLWYQIENNEVKVYEYLGNLGLFVQDISGVPGGTDNVPFVIISDLNDSNSIDVITETAGTYSILVEQIDFTKKDLPKSLIWEDAYVPIEKNNNGGTYNGVSIGVNELNNKRGTFAFGYANKIGEAFSTAIGVKNTVTGASNVVAGYANTSSGNQSIVLGSFNVNEGHISYVEGYDNHNYSKYSHVEGLSNYVEKNATNIHVEGRWNTVKDKSLGTHVEGFENTANAVHTHIEGAYNISNGDTSSVQGQYNVPDVVYPTWTANTHYKVGDKIIDAEWGEGYVCIEENTDTEFDDSKWLYTAKNTDGVFIIGNGIEDNRSNALKVTWDGDILANGNIYVNCNNDSTGGIKLAALSDVQVNGASIISNGVANIPIATDTRLGMVKLGGAVRGSEDNPGGIYIAEPPDSSIKRGTSTSFVAPISKQHIATFYGLAKAAGADEKNSTLPLGTYSDNAKAAIKSMIGVESDVTTIEVSGTAPTINGIANTRYLCGEVTSISITPPAYGICDVRFTSGSTVTVLTLPSTVKMPVWFDATALEANTIYEINIVDGVYGTVATWQL